MPHITAESYSNEQFESVEQSRSNDDKGDKIVCFLCKQQIPKSQAISHNAICSKKADSKDKKVKKYSPIREHPEELHSSNESSSA